MSRNQVLGNFGCGQYPKKGYINVDVDQRAKADIFHDLAQTPYPFDSEYFSQIEMHHVLEHIPNTIKVMKELHRILIPRGKLIITVPHFSRGFMHYDHKIGFDVTFPLYFNRTFTGGYTGIDFNCNSTHLTWFAQKELKIRHLSKSTFTIASTLGMIIDKLANLNPYVASRIFCFYVGGFEQIAFEFEKC
ncbi:class I SAM-dependent methyltransferase [Fundidesulfovibrio magnetotacticus]|uniref:class I SAM-dependent methyltransferase n=1 Tax=Fundidesulfovibrio magnetotacticus TaxID=2730080 RepID=UPI00156524C8|nr:methyltransferase domain-containing protein [Fundidesulfovibrio magnetotacticus]